MLLAALPLPGAGESRLHLSGPLASSVHRSFETVVGEEEIAGTPFASRCFYILHPSN